jgi:CheY-like chemotaxis protein
VSDLLPLILVCDDTPAKRYVISSWLRRDGFRVIEADTAEGARRILREEAVDLAVLDVHLPDGSGLDITRDLRSDPDLSATPVVHVSAIAVDTPDRVAGLDGGADAYLVDPIVPEELLSSIRALLRTSGARRHAERLAERLSRLNRAAVRLNVAATVGRLADAVAGAAAEVLGEPAVAVLLDADGAHRSSAAPGGAVDASTPLLSAEATALCADTRSMATVEAGDAPWSRVLPGTGPHRWRVCPVTAGGEPGGLVAVPASDAQESDDLLLERLAQLAAVALDNLRTLEREHRTALVLQRSLLPTSLPDGPAITIAARYRASETHAEVGGDFFDAFEVGSGRFVAIGDVQGHSLEAAIVMAELRYSMRAYAYDGYGPAAIMDRIDAVLVRNHLGLIATACIGMIDADGRSMRMVSAGHPPLVLVRDGRATALDTPGMLLGLGSSHEEYVVDLRPGDRLVLLTDGLVERRAELLDDSLARLTDRIGRMSGLTAEEAADSILAEFGVSEDDVALLVVDLAPDA